MYYYRGRHPISIMTAMISKGVALIWLLVVREDASRKREDLGMDVASVRFTAVGRGWRFYVPALLRH